MNRREFLTAAGAAATAAAASPLAFAAARGAPPRALILVELKGGNDSLNTVVPYADARYYRLRPRIAVARSQVLQLDQGSGLHPALLPLLPLWLGRELAVVRGLTCPGAGLSHLRAIAAWNGAAENGAPLHEGWLARGLRQSAAALPAGAAVIGDCEWGPLAGSDRCSTVMPGALQPAGPESAFALRAVFPEGDFGNAARTAAWLVGNGEVTALKISLGGFDTHRNQPAVHAGLLAQLGAGLAALRQALVELERWNSTLIMTYSEFGRRPRENHAGGTDHGTAASHFVLGGRVRGGLYGPSPALARLDGAGHLAPGLDCRDLYAAVLEDWLGLDAGATLGGRHRPLEVLRA